MSGRPTRCLVFPLVWGAAVPAVLWAALLVALALVVPGLMKAFQDLDMEVPAVTLFVAGVADWVIAYWYVLALFLPFVLVPDVLVIALLGRLPSRLPVQLWSGLMILLPLVAAALTVMALTLPDVQPLEEFPN